VGDGGEAGAIDHADRGEARVQRTERRGVPRRADRQQPVGEAGEDCGEEGRAEVPAALEEGLGAGLDEGLQRPAALTLPDPDGGEDGWQRVAVM